MRKCKNKCGYELPPASKCDNIIEKKGYCSVECLAEHARAKRIAAEVKKERAEMREAKERVKTRQEWIREAQRWFNKYIRLRDERLPCVSCGRHHKGQYHAGHFRTTAAAPQLRFDERNCHKQCAPCNNHLSGNIANYRPELINRIGLDQVESIESDQETKKWTIEELKEIKSTYKTKCKELEDEHS